MRYLIYFNPRSHERSDGLSFSLSSNPVNFNPRSHERSDAKRTCLPKEPSDFNPRSHERSDNTSPFRQADFRISIHAPTRGATIINDSDAERLSISIHAPTRGATSSVSMSMSQPYEFQSTLPREERQ